MLRFVDFGTFLWNLVNRPKLNREFPRFCRGDSHSPLCLCSTSSSDSLPSGRVIGKSTRKNERAQSSSAGFFNFESPDFFEPLQLHLKPSDLVIKLVMEHLVRLLLENSILLKYPRKRFESLFFPLRYLIRIYFVA